MHNTSNCCQVLEHIATESGLVQPVDSRLKFLLVLGARKAGTTWLYDALTTHPLFVGAEHGFRCALIVCFFVMMHGTHEYNSGAAF